MASLAFSIFASSAAENRMPSPAASDLNAFSPPDPCFKKFNRSLPLLPNSLFATAACSASEFIALNASATANIVSLGVLRCSWAAEIPSSANTATAAREPFTASPTFRCSLCIPLDNADVATPVCSAANPYANTSSVAKPVFCDSFATSSSCANCGMTFDLKIAAIDNRAALTAANDATAAFRNDNSRRDPSPIPFANGFVLARRLTTRSPSVAIASNLIKHHVDHLASLPVVNLGRHVRRFILQPRHQRRLRLFRVKLATDKPEHHVGQ